MIIRRPNDPVTIVPSTEPPASPARTPEGAPRFDIARLSENELVLFHREARESWIVYPPRSAYEHLRRPTPDTVLVEHHPWAPFSDIALHVVRVSVGCEGHGLACMANDAIQAGVAAGWNPFV